MMITDGKAGDAQCEHCGDRCRLVWQPIDSIPMYWCGHCLQSIADDISETLGRWDD